jgi:homoserine kinase type II
MSVYTTVTEAEITQFIQYYNVGKLISYIGISAGMENTNYAVDTTKGRFILTLYEHYNAEELPFFLDLMQHLSSHDVKTITPVADKTGQVLQSLAGKPAALIERLAGKALTTTGVSVEHCKIIGKTLAQFHRAGLSYDQKRSHDREKDLAPQLISKLLPKLSVKDAALLQQEIDDQQLVDWETLPAGIIHADLFCDNSIFDHVDNKLVLSGIIDLYLACNDAFIYDLAIVANDWCCHVDGTLDETRWLPLLRAYNDIRPITDVEKKVWVTMLRMGALRFWVGRLDIVFYPPTGDMVMKKDPNELKHKLQACLRDQQKINQLITSL